MMTRTAAIKPIPLWHSFLWFAIPGVAMLAGTTWINPWLVSLGVPLIWSFTLCFYGPLVGVGVAVLVAYRRDGYTWGAFTKRMRLNKPRPRDWAWGGGGLLLALIYEGIVATPASNLLASLPFFQPPPALPALFDPQQSFELPPTTFWGEELAGNGWVALVYAICLLINIGVEEIAWRGYLLPRQQAAHSRWAWVLNGVLWILILHIAIRWMYGGLLATGLITPFVAQRTGNTWMAVLIHGTGNFIFLVLILWGVMFS